MSMALAARPTEIVIPLGTLSVRMSAPPLAEETPDRLTFWWGITSSAVALGRHLESLGRLDGEPVLELGCGTGLAGVTAGLLGGRVTFTDYVEEALAFARRNSRLNGLHDAQTRFTILDWENPKDQEPFSLVLGAEVVYDYFFHGNLQVVLERTLSPSGRIMLADRKRLCVSRFMGRMIQRGFLCEETTSRVVLEGFPDQEVTIFTLRRGSAVERDRR
jgi:2-polyprenyl-3-methyl-5-hydroxy-6-metoxy-1,4-benzoquinol methylase